MIKIQYASLVLLRRSKSQLCLSLFLLVGSILNVPLNAQFSSNFSFTPITKSSSDLKLDPIEPIRSREFSSIEFNIDIDGERAISDKDLTLIAKNLPTGAEFTEKSARFSWMPSYDQAGDYTVTFIAKKGLLRASIDVQIHVENVPSAYFIMNESIITRSEVRERGVIHYQIYPMLQNVGDMQVADLQVSLSHQDNRVFFINGNAIRPSEVRFSQDPAFPVDRYFTVEYPLFPKRFSSLLKVHVDCVMSNGNRYQQEIPLRIAVGPVKHDLTGFNQSCAIAKYFDNQTFQLSQFSGFRMHLDPREFHAYGELAESGDLNGDGREDLIFVEESSARLSIISFVPHEYPQMRSQAVIMDGVMRNKSLLGTGDFNDDGTENLVVLNELNGEVETWPLDLKRIEKGWISSWPVPANCRFLKIADFDGDRCDDVLWHDTHNEQLVLWRQGMGYDHEVRLGQYSSLRHDLLAIADTNTNGTGTFDLVFQDRADGRIWVAGFQNGVWSEREIDTFTPTEWEFTASGYFHGNGSASLLFRNRSNAKEFRFLSLTGLRAAGEDHGVTQIPNLDFEWDFHTVMDINGDGKDDIVWSKFAEDPEGGNSHEMAFRIWVMNGWNISSDVGGEDYTNFTLWTNPRHW